MRYSISPAGRRATSDKPSVRNLGPTRLARRNLAWPRWLGLAVFALSSRQFQSCAIFSGPYSGRSALGRLFLAPHQNTPSRVPISNTASFAHPIISQQAYHTRWFRVSCTLCGNSSSPRLRARPSSFASSRLRVRLIFSARQTVSREAAKSAKPDAMRYHSR
jgi:hypothetical protein